jgi:hypothetical protein
VALTGRLFYWIFCRLSETPLPDNRPNHSGLEGRIAEIVAPRLEASSAWTLEVSSAGIDRPLTRLKDWLRYAGYEAKVELNFPGPNGRKRFTGTIITADAETARLKIETGETVALKLADVKKAKLILTDALIAFSTQPQLTN